MRPRRNHGDILDEDISFPLARLFDKFNLDHVPEKKRMELFEHRDLAHIKHYKAAVKIFGGPLSRKRVMVAPPMETPLKHRLGLYMDQKPTPSAPKFNNELKPQIPAEKEEPEELRIAREAREREDNYKQWFKERQKFRNDLENMGLNSNWLSKKPNKTVLENRVLHQLKEKEGKKIAEDEAVETPAEVSRPSTTMTTDSERSGVPYLKVPAPLGLQILDKHLKEQKLRLIDIFTSTDKNKDWNLSREEFIKSCEERNIPISKALLEDMLISLDMNLDDELNYKEMTRGMDLARRERREDKRKELSRESTVVSQKSGSQESDNHSNKPQQAMINTSHTSGSRRSGSAKTAEKMAETNTSSASKALETNVSTSTKSKQVSEKVPDNSDKLTTRSYSSKHSDQKSLGSKGAKSDTTKGTSSKSKSERTGSPAYLEPPSIDSQPERLVLKTDEEMVDLRKHDRAALKGYNAKIEGIPPTILTGSKYIDDHCMKSTLSGDVGQMMDDFRQKRLQEYFEIIRLCDENDVVLSKNLLEKVLLYPGEKPHGELQKRLRPPDSAPLVSSHFADPPKRPRTPIEVKHRDKVQRSKSGKLLIDSRHRYPMMKNVMAEGAKQNLSTGRAVIRRQIDCWMTFEEYEKLTRKYEIKYQHLHGSTNANAFWPGHLLDKVRLCMPPYNKQAVRDKESSLYTRIHRTPAVNYGYDPVDVWPTNSSMYTQVGIHDHFRNKTII
ncbi:EF-hand calcium binding domain 12 [Mactra antiquata]